MAGERAPTRRGGLARRPPSTRAEVIARRASSRPRSRRLARGDRAGADVECVRTMRAAICGGDARPWRRVAARQRVGVPPGVATDGRSCSAAWPASRPERRGGRRRLARGSRFSRTAGALRERARRAANMPRRRADRGPCHHPGRVVAAVGRRRRPGRARPAAPRRRGDEDAERAQGAAGRHASSESPLARARPSSWATCSWCCGERREPMRGEGPGPRSLAVDDSRGGARLRRRSGASASRRRSDIEIRGPLHAGRRGRASTRTATSGGPASTRSPAASSRRCTAAGSGRCASTRASRPRQETNRRFRYLLEQGQTGLSVAFDLPTQMGYDSDAPRGGGGGGPGRRPDRSPGRHGDASSTGIPLGEVTTSMTINSTAAILLALYVAAAERAGRRAGPISRHRPERHPQGVHRPRARGSTRRGRRCAW